MKISINNTPEAEIRADVLILPFFENYATDIYSGIDLLVDRLISLVVNSGDFTGKHGQTMLLPTRQINSSRILLVGLGKRDEISGEKIRQAGARAFSALKDLGVSDIAVSSIIFNDIAEGIKSARRPSFYFLEGGLLGIYCFEKYKTSTDGRNDKRGFSSIKVLDHGNPFDEEYLMNTVSSVFLARDLINTPANELTPAALAAASESVKGAKVKVLEEKDIRKEEMGAYLSVAKGSDEPLKFIIIEYGGGKGRPIALIGKSVTFDSGGLDIKPGEGMERMKYDMAGGAVVLSVIRAIAALKLPVNIVGILPAVENLIGGSASRPGDVVKTITGKTVEIISTDAEGRLTLADAIGYAIKYKKPRAIIDIATLTGACSMAFGNEAIAMMGTDAAIMERLRASSEEVHERVWPMPLFEEYKEYLKSDIADIKNVGGRKGALASSAYFLKEFAGDMPWVHLDIAGAAWSDKDRPYAPKGATGVGVRLLLNFFKEISS